MNLSIALNNALTGLRAASQQADTVANNVANALTEDYGRRETVLNAAVVGGQGAGVAIGGLSRAASPFLAEARRSAEASAASAETIGDALSRLSNAVGEPGAPRALATAADAFETALAAAADTPESSALLGVAVNAAKTYVGVINAAAAEADAVRTDADASIANQVETLNRGLNQIRDLNGEIRLRVATGQDASALEDQRDRLVTSISGIVPLKSVARPNGEIAIYAANGGQLLDGRVFELSFTPTQLVTADRTFAGGGLSGIEQNGAVVAVGDGGLLDGGSLSAAFEVRDGVGADMVRDLDRVAADLIQRLEGLPADGTLTPGDPGLFTNAGAIVDPLNLEGLARRIAVNAAVDPDAGGETRRLRDGLASVAAGPSGEDDLLRAIQDALSQTVAAPAGASALSGTRSASGFVSQLGASVLSSAAAADGVAAFSRGRADAIFDAERTEVGVDTDQELSRLLVIEQQFAASAKVIETIDELLARLNQI